MDFFISNLPIILCGIFGIALLTIEVFIPGVGLPGITGVILLGFTIFLTYLGHGGLSALVATVILLAIIAIVIALALRSYNRGHLSKSNIVLNTEETVQDGYVATANMESFIGKEGITTTVLRPTGMAEFNGTKLNVLSDGEYIAKDTAVYIQRIDGSSVVVKKSKKGF